MKLHVLQAEHFSCHACTNCCRDWHVELMAGEIESIQALSWPGGDPLHGTDVLLKHAGKTFLAHRADGACVFLNEANGRCRIHEQFGAAAKPLGCRLFPFQIASTFPGEASIIARYDCPTVRKNTGAPHLDALPELRRYANDLNLPAGFDDETCCHLEREQIEAVSEFVATMLPGFARDDERALFIWFLCEWLKSLGHEVLDRSSLAAAFAPLKECVTAAVSAPLARPGAIHRMAFRMLLGQYLRRDEDVLNRRAGRIGRALASSAFVMGFGSFRGLGLTHPAGKLRKARLFKQSPEHHDPDTFALFWRMIRNRLESFQFMGAGNSGRNFLNGLRSLALLYPLVLAAAKFRAANRDAARIEPEDVDYAVGAIEHTFGRSPILTQPYTRSVENVLLDPRVYVKLVRSV